MLQKITHELLLDMHKVKLIDKTLEKSRDLEENLKTEFAGLLEMLSNVRRDLENVCYTLVMNR